MEVITVPTWHDHRDSGWEEYEKPTKRLRLTPPSRPLALIKPLVWGVRGAFDTVQELTEGLKALHTGDPAITELQEACQRERLIQEARIATAQTLDEWTQAARTLDVLDGNDVWRYEESSDDYDVFKLKVAVADMESARENENLPHMLQCVKDFNRNFAGINKGVLYSRSRVGTKVLIERYNETAVDTLASAVRIANKGGTSSHIAKEVHLNMLDRRSAYGRTALCLSGGGTYGMQHIGVCKAMYQAGVLPQVISGTSAGSIVAAVLGTRTDEQVPGVLRDFCEGELRVFGKEAKDLSTYYRLKHLLNQGSFLDIQHLESVMQIHLGDMTFLEAYNQTHRILAIALSHVETRHGTEMLCDYKSTPHVIITSAVAASCSIPNIYAPASLRIKNPITGEISTYGSATEQYIDGSVTHDLPRKRLQEVHAVDHFIVSQVNPHIVPFLTKEKLLYGQHEEPASRTWLQTLGNVASVVATTAVTIAVGSAVHEVHNVLRQTEDCFADTPNAGLRIVSRAAGHLNSILGQTYTGDITIFPAMQGEYLHKVLKNPTPEFMMKAMKAGERATWPYVERIRSRMAIESAMDRAIRRTHESVAFSSSQIELRQQKMNMPSAAARQRRRRRSLRGDARVRSGSQVERARIGGFNRYAIAAAPAGSEGLGDANSVSGESESPFLDPLGTTSNLDTSASSDEEDTHSHNSPAYWRRFASQPASPSLASSAFVYTPSYPGSPVLERHSLTMTPTPAVLSPTASTATLPAIASSQRPVTPPASTPTPPRSAVSSPERRYKARFHASASTPSLAQATHTAVPLRSHPVPPPALTLPSRRDRSKAPPTIRLSSAIGVPEPHHEAAFRSLPGSESVSVRSGSPASVRTEGGEKDRLGAGKERAKEGFGFSLRGLSLGKRGRRRGSSASARSVGSGKGRGTI
ncbi:Lipase 5 [Oleoguttula sp. CCFEE 5521]